ncbi:MAG TPA: ferritin-like domain-containing protein [Solirubrobacteraceae bacterium]
MSQHLNDVYASIDRGFAGESAATRRKFVAGAAGTLGGLGLLALPAKALAANDAQTILNIAATAEVLATIVNTVGAEKVHFSSRVTKRNVLDAAYQELDHYNVLTTALGAKPATKKIWIPDALFESERNLLSGLVFGDGVFVNAYQIGVTAFGDAGKGTFARYAAEIMGIESVHRALALQSLGKPGNDQAFASGSTPYFTDITKAVSLLQGAGFGFGAKGKGPGKFYEFEQVKKRTQHRNEVHQLSPH